MRMGRFAWWDVRPTGPLLPKSGRSEAAHDQVGLEAVGALGMSRRPSAGGSASTGIVAPAGAGQDQVRGDRERSILMYQEPPARLSVPITRKKAAQP
jgi:hypothetical protein